MFGLSKLRLVEIGVALLLTLAALIFVGLTVWAAETGRISVADAWAAPAGGGSGSVAAYMTIANQGHEADVLKRVHSRKAKSVEMAQATMTADGVMQMRKVEDGLPIEGGRVSRVRAGWNASDLARSERCARCRRAAFAHARVRSRGAGRCPRAGERRGSEHGTRDDPAFASSTISSGDRVRRVPVREDR